MIKFTSKLDVDSKKASPAQIGKIRNSLAKFKPIYEEVVTLRNELLSHPELGELRWSIPQSSSIRDWGEHLGLTPVTLGSTGGSAAVSRGEGENMSKQRADDTLSWLAKDMTVMQKYLKEMKNIKDKADVISELFKLWQDVYTKYKSKVFYDWYLAAYQLYDKLKGVNVRREAGITDSDIEKYITAHASEADKKTIQNAEYFACTDPTAGAGLGKMTKSELQTRLRLIKKLFPSGSDSVVKKAVRNMEKVGMDYFNKAKAEWK